MQRCLEETARRRETQMAHNLEHNITPFTVQKSVDQVRFITRVADARAEREEKEKGKKVAEPARGYAIMEMESLEKMLEEQMRKAATEMDFELAAQLRDQLFEVRAKRESGAKSKVAAGAARGGR
jgi:excinuclease ABC subunit B